MISKSDSMQVCAVKACQKIGSNLKQISYEDDTNQERVDIPLCDIHYKKNQLDVKYHIPNYKFPKGNLLIIFVAYYMDNLQKKMELARFTSYTHIPKQKKDGSIMVNDISWNIVSIHRTNELYNNKDIDKVVNPDKITVEVLLKKKLVNNPESRGEKLLSCKELWDN